MSREQEIKDALELIFDGDHIVVKDYAGDQDHFNVEIVSEKFAGLNRVQRQQLVYKALGKLSTEVHAFQFQLSEPA